MLHPDFTRLADEAHRPETARLAHALTRLKSTLGFMQTGAHPDDETSGLLALLTLHDGHRISYACSTRGDGGQNSIGKEKGLDLAMIRTREMEEAAKVLDMALYWFGKGLDDPIRDFRFSKSAEETLGIWGYERTLERMVRIIREEKPDCLCPTFLDVGGQHGHHRAMTRIVREAFDCAGDAAAFPAHVAQGLHPWTPAKFYLPAWSGAGGSYDDEELPPKATLHHDIGEIDPWTGVPYARIGEWSRRFHATQGMGRWINPAPLPRPLHLAASHIGKAGQPEASLADGVPASLADWAREPGAPEALRSAADAVAAACAAKPFSTAMSEALGAGLDATRQALADCPDRLKPLLAHRLERKLQEMGAALAIIARREPEAPPPQISKRPETSVSMTPDAVMVNTTTGPSIINLDIAVSGGDSRALPSIQPLEGLNPAAPELVLDRSDALRFRLPLRIEQEGPSLQEAPLTIGGEPAQRVITVDTPHVGTVTRISPVALRIGRASCALPRDRHIAYLGGGHDQCDHWLRQIGFEVTSLAEGAFGETDLAAFSTVLVGIFAFGARADVAADVARLHAFVHGGGHLVTLYHRPGDGWDPETTPLAPITIGSPSLRYRVTDQAASVTHLLPEHPLLVGPNRISAADWEGWRKERGLYFAARWDPAYVPLLSMADPDEQPHHGALLSGMFGKGRHTHCALALHTEMENLTPGAFRILANLMAQVA